MPIRNKVQPISQILRFFKPRTFEKSKFVKRNHTSVLYLKPTVIGSMDVSYKRLVYFYDVDKIMGFNIQYTFQSRTDTIMYFVETQMLKNQTHCDSFSGLHDETFEETYPVLETEEQHFQKSMIHNLQNCSLQDMRDVVDLYHTYLPIAEAQIKK